MQRPLGCPDATGECGIARYINSGIRRDVYEINCKVCKFSSILDVHSNIGEMRSAMSLRGIVSPRHGHFWVTHVTARTARTRNRHPLPFGLKLKDASSNRLASTMAAAPRSRKRLASTMAPPSDAAGSAGSPGGSYAVQAARLGALLAGLPPSTALAALGAAPAEDPAAVCGSAASEDSASEDVAAASDAAAAGEDAATAAAADAADASAAPAQSRADEALREWLRQLDNGMGVMVQYFDAIKREFDALATLSVVILDEPVENKKGVVGTIDPSFWDACDVKPWGHRYLFAKGIKMLASTDADRLRRQGHAVDSAEEKGMFGAAQKHTQQVFAYACKEAKSRRDTHYLPAYSYYEKMPTGS